MRKFLLSLLLVCASACVAAPRPSDVVVFASGTDLESGNPLVTIHPLSRQVQRYVLFTTLARYDTLLEPVPYLARSWSWSVNRRELRMRIAGSVQWHDGVPTTAGDVAFTVLAARDPATGYPRAGDLAAVDTVEAPDDSTLVIRFSMTQHTFPLVLCELPIVPRHRLGDVPRSDMRRAPFGLAPTGNGPFVFEERVAGQRWVFRRNEQFPSELGGPPLIARLIIAVVDEPTTKFAGLASGELDFAGIAPTMAALASEDPTMRAQDYPILFSTALVFNPHRAPFDDARVRRAVSVSLDRGRIVSAALAGFGRPASGPLVPENPAALEGSADQNALLADSLFDAAGWERSDDGVRQRGGTALEAELLTVGSGDNAIEQLVQADLAERGVRIRIRNMEFGAFMTRARARPADFDVLLTGVSGDISMAFLAAMYDSRQRGSVLDYADYHTPALDVLFARSRAASPDERKAVWHEIQRRLRDEMPAAWIYHARGLQGIARRMQNVTMDLRGELESVARWSVAGIGR